MIKHMTKIAPSMSLRLVSSRILAKKGLSYYTTPALRDELVDHASQHHARNVEIYKRFATRPGWRYSDDHDEPSSSHVDVKPEVDEEERLEHDGAAPPAVAPPVRPSPSSISNVVRTLRCARFVCRTLAYTLVSHLDKRRGSSTKYQSRAKDRSCGPGHKTRGARHKTQDDAGLGHDTVSTRDTRQTT